MATRWIRAGAVTLALTSSLGCADDEPGFQVVPASGYFEPTIVDFGAVERGQAATLTVTLTNNGGEPLELRALEFSPRLDVFAIRAGGDSIRGMTLAPNRQIELEIVFGPNAAGSFRSSLLLSTETVQVELEVRGEGATPARFEGPSALEFGTPVEVNRTASQTFGLTNTGATTGRIVGAIDAPPFTVTRVDGAAFGSAASVPPGGRVELALNFRPTVPGPVERVLYLLTEDSARLPLAVRGSGSEAGTLRCTPSAVDLGESVRGSEARATVRCVVMGGRFTLASVALAQAQAFTLQNASAAPGTTIEELTVDVVLDAAGTAGPRRDVLELAAAHGAITTVPVTATVTPPGPEALDIAVALEWDADVDMDLHFVRVPAAPYSAGEDCHWESATLDWGVSDELDDDPYLDRDARRGPGAEVLSLARARDPEYDVWVQFFDANDQARATAVDFLVSWSLAGGAVVGQDTFQLERCGQSLHVGRIASGEAPRFTAIGRATDDYASRTFRCAP